MRRRDFFITTGIIGSFYFLEKLKAFDNIPANNYLSNLLIITDDCEKAVNKLQPHLSNLFNTSLEIKENELIGSINADIVAVTPLGLLNYKTEKNSIASILFDLSKSLNLPKKINNPYLLSISSKNSKQPSSISIYSDLKLIERIPISENLNDYKVQNNFGELYFNVKDRKIWVNGSSCKYKNCEHQGKIHNSGDNIICIPNRIRIEINGKHFFDADTY